MKTSNRFQKSTPEKAGVYGTLCALNHSFQRLLADFERLQQLGLFRGRSQREFIKSCRVTLEETRAWANFEITEALNGFEERDWARFGRLRRQLEKKLEDPRDIQIEAEGAKPYLRRKAGKKTLSKDRKPVLRSDAFIHSKRPKANDV